MVWAGVTCNQLDRLRIGVTVRRLSRVDVHGINEVLPRDLAGLVAAGCSPPGVLRNIYIAACCVLKEGMCTAA